jgi:hypothetical protein
MSKTKTIIGVAVLGLGMAVGIPLLAHGEDETAHGSCDGAHGAKQHMMQSGMRPMAMQHSQAEVGQRLGSLKQTLKLSTEQAPAWARFEQAVTTMASNRPMGHAHGSQAPHGNMADHAGMMQQHMAQMQAVFEARKALIDTLTEEQKATMQNFMHDHVGHHG